MLISIQGSLPIVCFVINVWIAKKKLVKPQGYFEFGYFNN